jgi:hypothetical protein
MRSWMLAQIDDRHATGMMMWATPTAMTTTCRQWVVDAGDARDLARCDQMVAWMHSHMGDWNTWMMGGGTMMGGVSP